MTKIRYIARALIALGFLLAQQPLHAMNDALLEQIRQAAERDGPEKARQLAEGIGVPLREARGQLLVPVIMQRRATEQAEFQPRLARAGASLDAVSRSYARVLAPVQRLEQLADQFPTEQLRAPFPAHPAFGLGSRVSQSVALTAADGYQAGNLDGTGVRVAVVDLGFSNLSNAISQGELPPNTCGAGLSQDFSGAGLQTGTPHGTGVAEHVADMAPGAELHCLKVSDLVGLQNAADYIANNNIQIANHSVAWAYASYYDGTGPVNAIINDSRNNDGVFWTISSGNFARKHWRGTWLDTVGDNRLEFAAGDELLALQGSAGSIAVFLNWNQYDTSNRTDLKFELLNSAGIVVASSDARQTAPFRALPYEAIGFSYQSSQAPYSLRVSHVGGVNPAGLDITLFSFNHDFEHRVAASSLMDPASAPGAFSVGAVNQASWQQANPPVESFSSQGPTNDGRQKPELVAPDGTASLTYGSSFGTSFSAPTTAGAAALLLQESPGLNAAALGNALVAEAIDVGIAGEDPVYGAGKLQLPLIDSDNEGLSNVEEIGLGTDALDSDSDDDGLTDFEEDRTYGTNPLAADSDGDGLSDYQEVVVLGTDPLSPNQGDLAPRGNPDGIINVADYLVLTRLVSGALEATADEALRGDTNNNGSLDTGDLVLLLQTVLGAPAAP